MKRQNHCSYIVIAILLTCACSVLAQSSQPVEADASNQASSDHDTSLDKITLLQAAVLGVVEGLTEYIPVSSTGHLILASHYMDLSTRSTEPGPFGPRIIKNDAIDAFEVVIQIGAILAVVGLYRDKIVLLFDGIVRRNPAGLRLLGLLSVAFLPAGILGLLLHEPITEYLFSPYTVAGALIVGGVFMIVIDRLVWRPRKNEKHVSRMEHIRYWQALTIGVAQCVAMWPGTSRSMVTILVGLIVGLNIVTAAEFSFLLALPTLGGATAYSCMQDWQPLMNAAGLDTLLVGIIVSGISAAIAVKLFIKWLTKHGMTIFGIYRILLGLAVFAYFARVFRS